MKSKYLMLSVLIIIISYQFSCKKNPSSIESKVVDIPKTGFYEDFPSCKLQIRELLYSNNNLYADDTLVVEISLIANPIEKFSRENIQVNDDTIFYSINYEHENGYNDKAVETWDGFFKIDTITQTIYWYSDYKKKRSSGSGGQTSRDSVFTTSFNINNLPYIIDRKGNYTVSISNKKLSNKFFLIYYSFFYSQFSDTYPYNTTKIERYLLNFIEFINQPDFKLIIYNQII